MRSAPVDAETLLYAERERPPQPSPGGSGSPDALPRIRLAGVDVQFGGGPQAVTALAGVNLAVGDGEFVAVVGPSGCGKSTLLRLVAGLLAPTGGTVELGGETVRGVPPGVGVVFQRPVLLDWRTVLANVLLPAELTGTAGPSEVERARALLAELGLAGFEGRRPRQLSGGMQQRAALARALLPRPAVLLLDEPFSALDAITREQLQAALASAHAAAGTTTVLVTHDLAEAVYLADRVALMTPRPGRVARVFDVPLPRPRPAEVRFEPAFVEQCRTIRASMAELGVFG